MRPLIALYCSNLDTFGTVYESKTFKLGCFALLLELLGNKDALWTFLSSHDMVIA